MASKGTTIIIITILLLLCCLHFPLPTAGKSAGNFNDLLAPYWAPDHIVAVDGEPLKLILDNSSGCGLGSKKKYLFGEVSMQIKLIPGDSAGTVTAFYMSSNGANHDELDFEFLGNVTGEPYLVQTNVYVNGSGDREQRHSLWFDPTVDFHTYTILWNRYHVRLQVDGVPIRVFVNRAAGGGGGGVSYPDNQAMGVYASLWNGDDWATQGGRVKTNWSHAPFVAAVGGVAIDACEVEEEGGGAAVERCTTGGGGGGAGGVFWWDAQAMRGLSQHQRRQLRWVQRRHLVYDYCKDAPRFTEMPGECLTS